MGSPSRKIYSPSESEIGTKKSEKKYNMDATELINRAEALAAIPPQKPPVLKVVYDRCLNCGRQMAAIGRYYRCHQCGYYILSEN